MGYKKFHFIYVVFVTWNSIAEVHYGDIKVNVQPKLNILQILWNYYYKKTRI